MSDNNSLHRFKRTPVRDDWGQCVICKEPVPTGFTLYLHDNDFLQVVTLCDGCIARARSKGSVEEKT